MLALGLVTVAAGIVLVRRTGSSVLHAAVTPNWLLLGIGFGICAGVQPLRAWAWSSTPVPAISFRVRRTP